MAAVLYGGAAPRVPVLHEVRIRGGPGLRIAQLSDLHLRADPALNAAIASRAVAAHADLVALTGDVIDDAHRLEALGAFLDAIDAAGNTAPIYAVTGNWEYWSGTSLDALARVYAAHRVEWLRDRRVRAGIGGRVVDVVGLDDGGSPRTAQPPDLLAPDAAVPLLVLAHYPQSLDAIAAALLAGPTRPLVLAGHTHGGQVAVFGWAPVVPAGSTVAGRRVVEGPVHLPTLDGYVSRGIGTSIIDLRWGVAPEITVVAWGDEHPAPR